MKKLLLASSALVLSAGLASAQGLSASGFGYMGFSNNNNSFDYGARLQVGGSVQADHGLTFGGYWRLWSTQCDLSGAACTNQFWQQARVFVEVDGFRLTAGNTNGAVRTFANTLLFYGFNPISGMFFQGTAGWSGFHNDGQDRNVLAQYSFGDIAGGVSYSANTGDWEIAARGTMDQFTIGLGYASAGGDFVVHGGWSDGTIGVAIGYDTLNAAVVLRGQYTMGDITLRAGGDITNGEYGLDVGYSLGGGATASATISTQNIGAGVSFNF